MRFLTLRKFSILVVFIVFLLAVNVIFAQEETTTNSGSKRSYELFWPLSAGKTVDDGFVYSLKKLKENLRGMLIFGNVEKADYSVFLATKRILEAEKLINENKYELVDKTLYDALSQLSIAEENIQGFRRPEKLNAKSKEMVSRLPNIGKLVEILTSRENSASGKLREVTNKVTSITKKLQD